MEAKLPPDTPPEAEIRRRPLVAKKETGTGVVGEAVVAVGLAAGAFVPAEIAVALLVEVQPALDAGAQGGRQCAPRRARALRVLNAEFQARSSEAYPTSPMSSRVRRRL